MRRVAWDSLARDEQQNMIDHEACLHQQSLQHSREAFDESLKLGVQEAEEKLQQEQRLRRSSTKTSARLPSNTVPFARFTGARWSARASASGGSAAGGGAGALWTADWRASSAAEARFFWRSLRCAACAVCAAFASSSVRRKRASVVWKYATVAAVCLDSQFSTVLL